MLWDIFCTVIDNHGDLGVSWRLAAELARRGEQVRLWVDDPSALAWMAPGGQPGVELRPWPSVIDAATLQDLPRPDVLLEAFGCEINPELLAHYRRLYGETQPDAPRTGAPQPLWINLEYLSAEAWVERCHGLPSPVQQGPAAGWLKWFFYPGFTAKTGGLIREAEAVGAHSSTAAPGQAVFGARSGASRDERLLSLFCYEPAALADWLERLHQEGLEGAPCHLLVMPGRPAAAVQALEARRHAGAGRREDHLTLTYRPPVPQADFDATLRACELNFVRGEDSLVRALWAGQAFVWQIYPQDDNAHQAKLDAFLDWLQAPADLREFHHVWNGLRPGPLPAARPASWRRCVLDARQRLLEQDDLVSQLLRFYTEKR